jgi:acyl-CoA thioesterase
VTTLAEPTVVDVPIESSWFSGPGAHGGFVAALTIRHAATTVPAGHHLRSYTARFHTAVGEGPLQLSAATERGSKRQSTVTVTGAQDGALRLAGTALFGAASLGSTAPIVVDPPVAGPGPDEAGEPTPGMVPFTDYFDFRWIGDPPLSGKSDRIAAWLRRKDPVAVDAAEAVLLLDVLPPSLFGLLDGPTVAVPSVDYAVHLVVDLTAEPLPPGSWVAVRQRCRGAGEGWAVDDATLHDESGRLLALATQSRRVLG